MNEKQTVETAFGVSPVLGVDVKIFFPKDPEKNYGKLLAFASVNLGGMFAVNGIRIYDTDKGPYVAMPSTKGQDGKYHDVCCPTTKEMRKALNAAVLNAYQMQSETVRRAFPPVYPHDRQYALEHGELKQCRASFDENIACREAIEKAINEGFDGMSLSGEAAKAVLAEFGAERVSCVLAATLQNKSRDGRFSRDNKAWAETIQVHDAAGDRIPYMVQSHPGILNVFVDFARKEMQAARARERPEKKPSIKAQLTTAKTEQAEKPDAQQHKKDKGAR